MSRVSPLLRTPCLTLAAVLVAALVTGCAGLPGEAQREAARRPVVLEHASDQALYAYLSGQWARSEGRPGEAAAWLARAAGAGRTPWLYGEAVDLALEGDRPAKAEAYARQWLEATTAEPEASIALARILAVRQRPDAAARVLVGLAGEDDPERILDLGARLARATPRRPGGDWRAPALTILQRWAAQESGSPWPHLARGHFLAQIGNRSQAAAAFRRALEIRPDWELAVVELARTQPVDKAIPALREFLGGHPEGLRARRHLAEALLRADRPREARTEYQRLIDQDEDPAEVWLGLGLAHFHLEQWDKAEQAFQRALARRSGYGAALFYLGRVAEQDGRYRRAANLYGQVEQGRYLEQSRLREAMARLEADQAQHALQVARQLRHYRPDEPGYYQLEARILLELQQPESAVTVAGAGLERAPDNPVPLRYVRALARERLGDHPGMEADIRAILERDPENADAYNFLGFSLAERGVRLQEALRLIRKANELQPDQAYIIDSLGWVHYRLGDLARAQELLERAVALNGNDAEIYLHLGVVRAARGQEAAARQAWRRGLEHAEEGGDLARRLRERLGEGP